MDDILLASSDPQVLEQSLTELVTQLQVYGLKIAPDKIQKNPPYSYLDRIITKDVIIP